MLGTYYNGSNRVIMGFEPRYSAPEFETLHL
jgi:hypothetical protein